MAIFLGVDTGGTYTDAVLLDDTAQRIIATAKALTSRPDLTGGIGSAIDAVLERARIDSARTSTPFAPANIAMVSLSTTLATNALVEGQASRAALVMIGFGQGQRGRANLGDALGDDPLIEVAGGHQHSGAEVAPLDRSALEAALDALPGGISALAVAAHFATRNPAHEQQARAIIRQRTGLPVTCSHELSAALNGPKRALTALLNARLIALIDRLVGACERHLARRSITAPVMVVRGDGALVSAAMVRERPIETILSGPAASVAGAAWLSGLQDALVSDIGGTTTDVCLLRGGKPAIDPQGARVGRFRTMVEAVAMHTSGLGGDSEIHVEAGLGAGIRLGPLRLGPRRLVPVALAATRYAQIIGSALDAALARDPAPDETWQFAIPLFSQVPDGLSPREAAIAHRLCAGPGRLCDLVPTRLEAPALTRLVQRGLVLLVGPTPTDAAHVLGRQSTWDGDAARKALTLLARRRGDDGNRLAMTPESMAQAIVDQMTRQTVTCLLETAFAEDPRDWALPSDDLAVHPLTLAALDRAPGLVRLEARLAVPVIGLGASASCYYGAVAKRLDCAMVVPEHAGVANAVGAVVGQVSMRAEGQVTCPAPGLFIAHMPQGPAHFADIESAIAALEAQLRTLARERAARAGVETPRIAVEREDLAGGVEGKRLVVEVRLRVNATGRPRIATNCPPSCTVP